MKCVPQQIQPSNKLQHLEYRKKELIQYIILLIIKFTFTFF